MQDFHINRRVIFNRTSERCRWHQTFPTRRLLSTQISTTTTFWGYRCSNQPQIASLSFTAKKYRKRLQMKQNRSQIQMVLQTSNENDHGVEQCLAACSERVLKDNLSSRNTSPNPIGRNLQLVSASKMLKSKFGFRWISNIISLVFCWVVKFDRTVGWSGDTQPEELQFLVKSTNLASKFMKTEIISRRAAMEKTRILM